jgi:DNA polymerase III delta prime subunit
LLALAGVLLVVAGLARQRIGDVLAWAKENWLSATALSTAAAVAGVVVPFVIRWLDRRRPARAVQATYDPRQRRVMLQRVRYKWITGVLEPSLAHAAHLALGLERRPDTLDLGARVLHRPDGPPRPLPAGTRIGQVFDQVGGGLLILGAPGAGKTTLLLELARELLDRAEQDAALPIPVVVNLASWAQERKALAAWLVDELADAYKVPRRIASAWVGQDTLALLLDGLDEVAGPHRAGCVAAINAHRDEHGLVPVVVCSRTAELQMLRARLRLEEAVELQPPSDAQVDDYLGRLEATGTPLADVRAAMRTDPTLRELLRSPLLLHVVAIAYHGEPAAALQAPGTLAQRRAWLWRAYVARMFRQRPLDPSCGYTDQQALGWLAWLARALRDRDQSEFQLDRLTADWLPTRARKRRARRLTGLAVALGIGLLVVLAGKLLVAWSQPDLTNVPFEEFESAWAKARAREELVGSFVLAAVGLVLALGSLGLAGRLTGGITPAEELHWSWSGLGRRLARRLLWGLAWGLVLGLLIGLLWGLVFVLPDAETGLDLSEGIKVRGLVMVGFVALVIGVLFGGVFGVVFGLTAGLTAELRDERTLPNEGIRRSARHALTIGLAVALLITLLVASISGGLAGGLGLGLMVAPAVGLVFGGAACLQHYRLRASLARAKVAPWRYGRFLEAMTERLLLRRSGSGYLFVHRLLRDYLADLAPDQPPAVLRAAAASH